MTDLQIASYQAQGFELALHNNTGCQNFTPASLPNTWTTQRALLEGAWASLLPARTNRTHCIPWSDWSSQPKVQLGQGVRLDTNYYYWPGSWVRDRPGLFTGSGFPMRFADTDGTLIDVYQAATQLTDESEMNIPVHVATLLDNALGPKGLLRGLHGQYAHGPPQSPGRERDRVRGPGARGPGDRGAADA
jgi:hypothetical protein